MSELRPAGYAGTPSFLKIIPRKPPTWAWPLPSVKSAGVRETFRPACATGSPHAVAATSATPPADIGLIVLRNRSPRRSWVLDEGVLVEIVRPGTGDPVPGRRSGRLVITTLNPDHPLIRFGTGDLSAVLPGPCPTGRTATRIKGWMGRADQTTKVRHVRTPRSAMRWAAGLAAVGKARPVVSGEMANDQMTLLVESTEWNDDLRTGIEQAVREVTNCVPPWHTVTRPLPNDGKDRGRTVISDAVSHPAMLILSKRVLRAVVEAYGLTWVVASVSWLALVVALFGGWSAEPVLVTVLTN